jgi:NifU-like protein
VNLSKKLREKLDRLKFVGFFTPELAKEKNMRLVKAREGNLTLYWLVDETDGVIADAKYQVFGPVGLIGAAEVASELVLRKTYDQASRLSADLIDQHVPFPRECDPFLNQVLTAIDVAVQQCLNIPFAVTYDMTPIESDFGEIPGGIPGWEQFPYPQKMKILEEVIDKEIRPYIELDAGGVKLISLQGSEVVIAYEGSCTSCHSSTGSTLSAIQKILKSRVHPTLFVTPQL